MNRRRPGRPEAGMVTVEIAFAVMAAAVVALGLAYLIALVIQLGELHAVAGEVARQQARGDVAAAERAERGAPSGTRLQVGREQLRVLKCRGGLAPPAPVPFPSPLH